MRVLVVDDDTARARWLWNLARRAHPAAIVEIASEGTDAAHKLNRDQPDLVFVDAALRGVMNAFELCMYARGLEDVARSSFSSSAECRDRDRALFDGADVPYIAEGPICPTRCSIACGVPSTRAPRPTKTEARRSPAERINAA